MIKQDTMSDCLDFDLTPEDNPRLANMCGQFNEHLRQIEKHFGVNINSRGNHFQIYGQSKQSEAAMNTIKTLYDAADTDALAPSTVQLILNDDNGGDVTGKLKEKSPQWNVRTRKGSVQGRKPMTLLWAWVRQAQEKPTWLSRVQLMRW